MAVSVDDIEESYDIGIVHLFEQGDFSDSCTWDALIFGFETDFLERDDSATVLEVPSFVDYTVRS